MTPTVLAVVPSYNHGRFVGERIRSVVQQDYQNIHLAIIDDGSSDETVDVLSKIDDSRIAVTIRDKNSGSPFTAWMDACNLIEENKYEYIWIAESDDRADLQLVSRAISKLRENPNSSLYYCHSWFVNEDDLIIGHSINYLKTYFPDIDWTQGFSMDGNSYIERLLVKGMAIPNMSSAIMRSDAFVKAVRKNTSRYKLAGDWVFAIDIAKLGNIIFEPWDGNYFRHHSRTSRSETRMANVVFEHMMATRHAYETSKVKSSVYFEQMVTWGRMYRHEKVGLFEFFKIGMNMSIRHIPIFIYWTKLYNYRFLRFIKRDIYDVLRRK